MAKLIGGADHSHMVSGAFDGYHPQDEGGPVGGGGEMPGATMGGRSMPPSGGPGGPAETSPLRGKSFAGVKADENSSAAIEQAAGNRKNPSFAGTPSPSAPMASTPKVVIPEEESPFDAVRKKQDQMEDRMNSGSSNMAPASGR